MNKVGLVSVNKLSVIKEVEELFKGYEQDYEGLKEDIKRRGIKVPLVITVDGGVICGNTRLRIARELGIGKVPCITERVKDIEEIKRYAILDNLRRRQLNDFQKVILTQELYKIEKGLAEVRERAGRRVDPGENLPKGRARDIVASKIGISGRSYEKAVKVLQEAPEELKQQAMQGKLTIDRAYQELKKYKLSERLRKGELQVAGKSEILLCNDDLFNALAYHDRRYDLIFVDPPYGILDEGWDKFDGDDYWKFAGNWLLLILPLLKKAGRIYIMMAQTRHYEFFNLLKMYAQQFKLQYGNTLIWYYPNNLTANDERKYKYTYELIFYFYGEGAGKLNKPAVPWGDECAYNDVWEIATPQTNFDTEPKLHPAQKPVKLIERIILTGSKEGDWILDPMAGSGTVGVVCSKYNRNCMMIEKDKEYCKLIQQRVKCKLI